MESPTALLTRREMQSWRIQQLEPSALREPDRFTDPPRLTIKGGHLPASLYFLARSFQSNQNHELPKTWIYDQMASRLSELIEEVDTVKVDRDEKREILTMIVKHRDATEHPADCLSDGTLRFLALSLIELDDKTSGLICLEEPENGIHPGRIPAILKLLQDIAMDVEEPMESDSSLRQVIVNTHSPRIVHRVLEESLVIAELREIVKGNARFKGASFSCLPGTWRTKVGEEVPTVALGDLLYYINPYKGKPRQGQKRRVMDREDIQRYLPFNDPEE